MTLPAADSTHHLLIRSSGLRSVLAAGILLRLVVWFCFDRPLFGDAATYLASAENLVRQGTYVGVAPSGTVTRAAYPPGYILTLAGWGAVAGFSALALTILNTVIDATAARVALNLDGSGRTSAILFLWPTFILSAPIPQKEGLVVLLVITLAALANSERANWKIGLAYGSITGLLALTQPATLLVAGTIALIFRWRSWRLAPVAMLGFFAVLAPWVIRNWNLFHQLVPLTTSFGEGLYVTYYLNWIPLPPVIASLSEPAQTPALLKHTFDLIVANPAIYATNVIKQGGAALLLETQAAMRVGLPTWPTQIAWAALAAAAAFGRDRRAIRLLLAVLLGLAPMSLTHFQERHRVALVPVFAVLASSAFERTSRRNFVGDDRSASRDNPRPF